MTKMNNFKIRKVEISDADQIRKLCLQLDKKISQNDLEERIKLVSKIKNINMFVLVDRSKVIGFVLIAIRWEFIAGEQAVVEGLVVDGKYRGQGLGKLLMAEAEDWSRKRKMDLVRLNSNVTRKEAHKFYEKIGYEKTKEQAIFNKKI